MNTIVITSGAILLSIAGFCYSQKSADFAILSQPRDYTILNQYQQPLSDAEKKSLGVNLPAQIENDDELLGDQITHALRFDFDGRTWFLQKDEAGNLIGDRGKQFRQMFRKCTVLGDTLLITEDRAVPFSEKFPPAGQGKSLGKGEAVVRIFSTGQFVYVKRGDARAEYGWCSFARRSAWKAVEHAVEKPQALTGHLSDQIVRRFAEANKVYKEYFDHFNEFTHQEKTVPAWQCEASGNEVRCTLNLPYRNSSQLEESTQYLVRDVENMLIGKHYEVVGGKGEILVKPKADAGARQ